MEAASLSLRSASRSISSWRISRSTMSSSVGREFDLDPQPGRRLVDEVDRLVGEEAVGDVALGEGRGGDDRGVGDAHPVVDLVALLEPAEDGDGVGDRRLVDHHRLEAALQGGVLLDVLAVLVEGGRADAAQLAAGERRLEHVAGVHGALGGAGSDHGVQLVDEEDHPAVGGGDLLEHGLEPILELAAVLGPRHHRAQVEGHQAAVAEPLGNVAARHPLSQSLGDRGLAHPGLADQDGVVLGPAGEHLDDPADLVVAPDHRVELAPARGVGEVAPVLLEGVVLRLRVGVGHPLGAAHRLQGRVDLLRSDPRLLEHPGRLALGLADDGEQEVLGRDVLVLEPGHLVEGRHQHGAESGAHGGLGGADLLGPRLERRLQARGQRLGLHLEAPQQSGDQALVLVEQGEQEVLGLDGGVLEAGGGRLGGLQCLLGTFGESIQAHVLCIPRGAAREPPGMWRAAMRRHGWRAPARADGRHVSDAPAHGIGRPPCLGSCASIGTSAFGTPAAGQDYDASRSHRWPLSPSAPPSC